MNISWFSEWYGAGSCASVWYGARSCAKHYGSTQLRNWNLHIFEDSETLDRKIDGSGFQIIENIMRKAAAIFSEPWIAPSKANQENIYYLFR